MATTETRIPPHDSAAEQAVLGALLLSPNETLGRVLPRLVPVDFYLEGHRILYRHIGSLAEAGEGVDLITVQRSLAEAGELEQIGGMPTLALLTEMFVAAIPAHIDDYVRAVLADADKREIIQQCAQALTRAYDGEAPGPIANELGDAMALITDRAGSEDSRTRGPRPVGAVVRAVERDLDLRDIDVLPTPVPELTERLQGGVRRGQVIYLTGPAAAAKTALAVQWAALVANSGHRTVMFSREMLAAALARRFLAQQLRIPAGALLRRDVSAWQRTQIREALPRFEALPLDLDDTAETIGAIKRIARRGAYRFVIVDYLQLVSSPADSRDERRELEAVSRDLKRLAMRAPGCSVLALSAVSRLPVEERGKKKRPRYVLRGSERLEHDADVVLALYRPDEESDDRVMEFRKVREGRSGGVTTLNFASRYVTFDEVPAGREPGDEVPF